MFGQIVRILVRYRFCVITKALFFEILNHNFFNSHNRFKIWIIDFISNMVLSCANKLGERTVIDFLRLLNACQFK